MSQRIIRFRAVIKNKIYEVVNIEWSAGYRADMEKFRYVTVMGDGHETFDDTQAILIQSTGLTDSKGREIWEGDVIENGVGQICEVDWMYLCHLNLYCRPEDSIRVIEVLGNIYESPELLKEKP